MSVAKGLNAQQRLRIKKFFDENDPNVFVKSFISKRFGKDSENGEIINSPKIVEKPKEKHAKNQVIIPSVAINIKKGCAFDDLANLSSDSTACISLEIMSKLYQINIGAPNQTFVVEEEIISPLSEDISVLFSEAKPLRMCISLISPDPSFVGMSVFDWRRALTNEIIDTNINMLGLQGEIVGILSVEIKLVGFNSPFDISKISRTLELQIRQETLDSIEQERINASEIKSLWKEIAQLLGEDAPQLLSQEMTRPQTSLFSYISPFTIRSLPTPGHCLRFCSILSPIITQNCWTVVPNWVAVYSKCGSYRTKCNLLVSLLRGFGMNAYVAISQPYPIVVAISDIPTFFDITMGKFSNKIPQRISNISLLYNEASLFINMNPHDSASVIDWNINNPIKWKIYKPQNMQKQSPPVLSEMYQTHTNSKLIVSQVKKLIEAHRKSIGLSTKWNSDLEPILQPILMSYESERISGQTTGVHSIASESIRRAIKPYHSLKAAPAFSISSSPSSVFNAISNTTSGMDIISSNDNESSFTLSIKQYIYPGNTICNWVLLALDSVSTI